MDESKTVPCMKCGRETESPAVFCSECLEDMEKHPVKPGTPVILHQKPTTSIRRAPTRRAKKIEDQLRSLKRTVIWLWTMVILLTLALGAVTFFWLTHFGYKPEAPRPGENYQTSQTQTTSQ